MYSDNYNYSVSLIRRRYGGWVIDPNDAVSSVFAAKLRGKKVGEGYMASIIEGQLSHCIFLSGGVCHSDIYGWLITVNGWQILELDIYLQLAQEIWELFGRSQLGEHDVRQILQDIIETKGLVRCSSPTLIDGNTENSYCVLLFTPKVKLSERVEWWELVAVVLGLVLGLIFGAFCYINDPSMEKKGVYRTSSYDTFSSGADEGNDTDGDDDVGDTDDDDAGEDDWY
jgi:hypothetical protein